MSADRRMILRQLIADHAASSPVEIVAAIEAQVTEWVTEQVRAEYEAQAAYGREACGWCGHENLDHRRCVYCDCTGPTAIAAHVVLPEGADE